MRTAAAAALMLVIPLSTPQEKHALEWKPPEKRIVVVKAKCTTLAFGPQDEMFSYECETELGPIPGDSPAGPTYAAKVNRFDLKAREADKIVELKFERDKEPAFEGHEPPEDIKTLAKRLGGEHKTVISGFGKFNCNTADSNPVLMLVLGRVDVQLPMLPIATGTLWENTVQIALPGPDFDGKLMYELKKVEKTEKGKIGRIRVTAAPKGKAAGEDFPKWQGSGDLAYSFDDRLISTFKFKLTQKDKEGKVLRSLEQELSISLKP